MTNNGRLSFRVDNNGTFLLVVGEDIVRVKLQCDTVRTKVTIQAPDNIDIIRDAKLVEVAEDGRVIDKPQTAKLLHDWVRERRKPKPREV